MTRRKRTPDPEPQNANGAKKRVSFAALPVASSTSLSSFQIPASLQKLSSLSASLAQSADAPRELQNSEIVKRAQALVEGASPPPTSADAAVGRAGRGGTTEASSDKVPNKELKWKTKQKVFPQKQTWVQPVANYATAGHARALATKYAAAAATAAAAEDTRLRAEQAREAKARDDAARNGAVQYPQVVDRSLDMTSSTPRYQVRMDGRVTLTATPVNGDASGPVADGDDTASTGEGSAQRKKRKHIEFVEKHQRDFPSEQTWVKPPPLKARRSASGTLQAVYGGRIMNDQAAEARRRATIAGLQDRSVSSPVNAVRPVSGGRGASRSVSAGSLGQGHERSTSSPQASIQAQTRATALDYSKNQGEIAALIAKKRAENAASGQQQRLLELRMAHQSKVAAQPRRYGSHLLGPLQRAGAGMAANQLTPTPLPPPSTGIVPAPQDGMGVGGHGSGGNDSDEDAPGEDDETDASPIRPSIEDGPARGQQIAHLITDPGDLGSLFSSRDSSPPLQPMQPAAKFYHRANLHGDRDGTGDRRTHVSAPTASGYAAVQPDDTAGDEEDPMSPSAQLLMALANATPPPSWNVDVLRQQSGRRRAKG